MKIELFKQEAAEAELVLIDTFHLTNLNESLSGEIVYLQKEKEKAAQAAKKKADKEKKVAADAAAKKANETAAADGEETKAEAPAKEEAKVESKVEPIDDTPIPVPKIKISVEFSRSGYMEVTKANAGSHFIDVEHQRKEVQLNNDQMRAAKSRLRWYEQRDSDKIKTDKAKNDYESMIYKLREWLREDENAPYVQEALKESRIEQLSEQEDWLYDEGSALNYTVY